MQYVIETQAHALGYLYFHDRSAKLNKPGFPDLHIVGYGRHWVFELKKEGEEPTAIQKKWLSEYLKAGVDARAVWPKDLEQVIKVLQDGYQDYVLRGSKS